MDEQTATQMAAAQIVDSLGAPAGFMIAMRLIQVIAERTSPKTPELVEAFAECLQGMERFAEVSGLSGRAGAAEEGGGKSNGRGGNGSG